MNDEIDYRVLLKKYMKLVGHEEGVTFVNHAYEPDFDRVEIAVLENIETEIDNGT